MDRYSFTLDYLYNRLPMFQRTGPAAYKDSLENTLRLDEMYESPHRHYPTLHIAGTNGKGSVSHMLAALLQSAGYRCGLYTSPHMKDFRERIRINGKMIPRAEVVRWVEAFRIKNLAVGIEPSFFELTAAMAFDYFVLKKVDIAVVEVGLGGRLDSTNIIVPEVSLITNIGMDHKEILGDTLEKIAFEKAGIIKPHVPVVVSEFQEETFPVFVSRAKKMGSPIVFASETVKETYGTDLLGSYQKKNMKGVIATLRELNGFKVSQDNIAKGLQNVVRNTGLMGRWQILQERPTIICDTAHNKEGFNVVMEQLEQLQFDRMHFVIGFVKEKALEEILPLFPKDAFYYFTKPNISRGLEAYILQGKALEFGLKGEVYVSVKEALNTAKQLVEPDDLIYVGGSNFVVAEVV